VEADLKSTNDTIHRKKQKLTGLSGMENRITIVKDVLSNGILSLTEFGIFGSIEDEYIPIGFNT
jgi:hypothetical protein